MVQMEISYKGALRCELKHGPSGTVVETDAPADMGGQAARFSPTDLVGAALAACIATTLGIVGKRKGWSVDGMKVHVGKVMTETGPRKIARLPVEIWMPANFPQEHRAEAERIAHTCPVHKSLNPDIDAPITTHW